MRSLHTKILTLLLGCVLAASLLIGGTGIICAQRAISEGSAQIMDLLCHEQALKFDQMLHAIEQSVNTDYSLADHLFSNDERLWDDPGYLDRYIQQMEPVLENTARNTDSALAVYLRFDPERFTSTAGHFLIKRQGVFCETGPTDMSLYDPDDPKHAGWYDITLANRGPTWMEPYYNANIGSQMISYIIPIYRGEQPIGILGMDIDSALLVNAARDISVYDTGYAFLMTERGDIFYHPDYPDGIAKEDFDESLRYLGWVLDERSSDGQIYTYDWHGQTKRLTFDRLNNGMYLAIAAPASEIDAEQGPLIVQCMVIFLIVLLAATLFGSWLVGKIVRPLMELTEAAQKIAKGEWDVVIHSGAKDEVGILASALRETIGKLKQYIQYVSGLAYTDVTTGVGNKQAYNEQVAALEQAIAEGSADFSFVILDINSLKHINDTYGHGKGDRFLVAASALIKKVFGMHKLYRICDDGFAVLLDGVGQEGMELLCQELEAEIEDFNRQRNACPEELTIALGAACFDPERDASFSDIYSLADRKLYQSKKLLNGRRGMLEDALKMLQMVFHKILRADLTQDDYYEIKAYEAEHNEAKGYRPLLSAWLRDFALTGQVHPDDRPAYLAFADLPRMRERLRAGEGYQSVRYRRMVGDAFRWVQMEILTSVEYTDQEQIVLLYVRDIHDSYTAELEYRRELERLNNTDSLTGLWNRHYMTTYCQSFAARGGGSDVGVVFCDLNGLKYMNDHFGHAEGDKLIVSLAQALQVRFPRDRCCRMSGDEFIVFTQGTSEAELQRCVDQIRQCLSPTGVPLTSVGYCWREQAEILEPMIGEAEDDMYRDKERFYEAYPLKRR